MDLDGRLEHDIFSRHTEAWRAVQFVQEIQYPVCKIVPLRRTVNGLMKSLSTLRRLVAMVESIGTSRAG